MTTAQLFAGGLNKEICEGYAEVETNLKGLFEAHDSLAGQLTALDEVLSKAAAFKLPQVAPYAKCFLSIHERLNSVAVKLGKVENRVKGLQLTLGIPVIGEDEVDV